MILYHLSSGGAAFSIKGSTVTGWETIETNQEQSHLSECKILQTAAKAFPLHIHTSFNGICF